MKKKFYCKIIEIELILGMKFKFKSLTKSDKCDIQLIKILHSHSLSRLYHFYLNLWKVENMFTEKKLEL